MRDDELLQAFSYRLEGFTFQDIGEKLGYSKQNIQLELDRVLRGRKASIRYRSEWQKNQPKLTKIILGKYGNLTNFCKETGCDYRSVHNLLQGVCYPRQKVMTQLLKVTGLKYSDIMGEFLNED